MAFNDSFKHAAPVLISEMSFDDVINDVQALGFKGGGSLEDCMKVCVAIRNYYETVRVFHYAVQPDKELFSSRYTPLLFRNRVKPDTKANMMEALRIDDETAQALLDSEFNLCIAIEKNTTKETRSVIIYILGAEQASENDNMQLACTAKGERGPVDKDIIPLAETLMKIFGREQQEENPRLELALICAYSVGNLTGLVRACMGMTQGEDMTLPPFMTCDPFAPNDFQITECFKEMSARMDRPATDEDLKQWVEKMAQVAFIFDHEDEQERIGGCATFMTESGFVYPHANMREMRINDQMNSGYKKEKGSNKIVTHEQEVTERAPFRYHLQKSNMVPLLHGLNSYAEKVIELAQARYGVPLMERIEQMKASKNIDESPLIKAIAAFSDEELNQLFGVNEKLLAVA